MISLLKSKSDLFNIRAVYVSADKLSVHTWHRGKLASSYLFDVDEQGRENFERYLEDADNTPVYVLVDIVEEEFRQDTIPHVFGPDRDSLIKRKQSRLFRDSNFQYAEVQGREEEGRRDDKYLFMALTNNELLEPWLAILDKHKVAIKGIISLPQLLQSYVQSLPDVSDYALFVSMQSISGLRQTFFLKKQLKMSRLSKLPRFGTEPYAPKIRSEIEKIQRYLNSLRLIPLDQTLNVYILADEKTIAEFDRERPSTPNVKYNYLNVSELGKKVDIEMEKNIPFGDQLFLAHLLSSSPKNYYASDKTRRYWKMRSMRISMNVCSMLIALFSVIYCGYSIMGGLLYKQQSEDAKIKAEFYQGRYNMAKSRLPETPVDSYKIQTAVKAASTIMDYKSSPVDMLTILGQSIKQFPRIKLDDINWAFSAQPVLEKANGNNSAPAPVRAPSPNQDETKDFRYYQVSTVNAHISPFDGDYREAIAIVNSFAETLRDNEQVHDVVITSFPLDISSAATLQGSVEVQAKEALFSLQTIIGIN